MYFQVKYLDFLYNFFWFFQLTKSHTRTTLHPNLRNSHFPPDDEPSGYTYKVRSSGLADFSRLRMNSVDVHVHAG